MPEQFLSAQRKLTKNYSYCAEILCMQYVTFLFHWSCHKNGVSKQSNSQTLFIQFSLFKSAKQTLSKWQMPKHNELFAVVFGLNTKCYRHEVDARRIKLPKPFKSVTQTCGLQFISQRQKSSDHCGSNASLVLTQLRNPGPSP